MKVFAVSMFKNTLDDKILAEHLQLSSRNWFLSILSLVVTAQISLSSMMVHYKSAVYKYSFV